jgi:hypothetical protein
MIETSWFYFSLINVFDYVEFEPEKADEFETMTVSTSRIITEIQPDELLNFSLISAQNQIGNVCKNLRNKRKEKEGESNSNSTKA